METTYDVRIWKTEIYRGKNGNTYYVRWQVARVPFKQPYGTSKLAESFRSDLVSAARKGEAFDRTSGLPVSMVRNTNDMSWFDFACAYVDMKWIGAAGNSRKGVAETLATVTPHMLATKRGKPADKTIRRALNGWAFNMKRRESVPPPADIADALAWLRVNTRPVSVLAAVSEVRAILALMSSKLDGKPAAASVVRRKHAVLFNAMEYAVEHKLLSLNPLTLVKVKVPKPVRAIDKRVVVNPQQARTLLDAVKAQEPSGQLVVAYFAVMYYSVCGRVRP